MDVGGSDTQKEIASPNGRVNIEFMEESEIKINHLPDILQAIQERYQEANNTSFIAYLEQRKYNYILQILPNFLKILNTCADETNSGPKRTDKILESSMKGVLVLVVQIANNYLEYKELIDSWFGQAVSLILMFVRRYMEKVIQLGRLPSFDQLTTIIWKTLRQFISNRSKKQLAQLLIKLLFSCLSIKHIAATILIKILVGICCDVFIGGKSIKSAVMENLGLHFLQFARPYIRQYLGRLKEIIVYQFEKAWSWIKAFFS